MSGTRSVAFSGRRLGALVYKESLQVVRDPAAILATFALPAVMMLVFAFGLSLDQSHVPIGLVLESDAAEAHALAAAFSGSRYFDVTPARDRREVESSLVSGAVRGFVVIPEDFDTRVKEGSRVALVQIVTDGSQPNTANFVAADTRKLLGLLAAIQMNLGAEAGSGD